MRAFEGYYENDRFSPKGLAIRAKGRTKAILTLLDETRSDTAERLEEFDKITEMLRSDTKTAEKPEIRAGAVTYALNSDAAAYFIQGGERISGAIRELITQGCSILIPPTVFFEIRRGFIKKPSPAREGTFDCICKIFPIGELSVTAWEHAARIYADSRTAGYPISDIITAAFCVAGGHKLITTKPGRFEGIEGLTVINWKEYAQPIN